MILANVAAAETLERARLPFIYRVHDEPSMEKVIALREFLRGLNIAVPNRHALKPRDFNRILAAAQTSAVQWLVHELVLRSQSQAEYAAENYGHFGLNLKSYAHSTSSIRRYADLTVHRGLLKAIGFEQNAAPAAAAVAPAVAAPDRSLHLPATSVFPPLQAARHFKRTATSSHPQRSAPTALITALRRRRARAGRNPRTRARAGRNPRIRIIT